ncbi:DUF2750 domain-containing protein [Algibacillus agarilyticus]|uniref:DUF2750 domain-containing protein n=1 Tax=Algibacillus agarilyticus TaxID=2234133 RepID=UPI00130029EF|nr:DUF2750 domain-containing protein [Algibacillus agarilyticus]
MLDIEQIETLFCQQIVELDKVWTIQDEKGIPTPLNSENIRSMPFWSELTSAESFIAKMAGYEAFQVLEIAREAFVDKWISGIHQDGLCIGLNWSAESDNNIDIEPAELADKIKQVTK